MEVLLEIEMNLKPLENVFRSFLLILLKNFSVKLKKLKKSNTSAHSSQNKRTSMQCNDNSRYKILMFFCALCHVMSFSFSFSTFRLLDVKNAISPSMQCS